MEIAIYIIGILAVLWLLCGGELQDALKDREGSHVD